MIASVRRLKLRAWAMLRRSPATSVIGAGHCDIRAGSEGDADVGLREGRRIVDSVPRHRHDQPVLCISCTSARFSCGNSSAWTSPMPTCRAMNCAVASAIAGRHDHVNAFGSQLPDGGVLVGLDRIGDAEEGGELAIDRQEEHRHPLLAHALDGRRRAEFG